jgi:hypothetical protein
MIFITRILFIVLFYFQVYSFAQWVNDPRSNTPLVINPKDPTNITVLGESKEGAFIIWQDIVTSNLNNVFFLHFNKDGQVSFRSDGKAVSLSQFNKLNPVAVLSPKDEVIILWKEIISTERQSLSIQKVNSSGLRLWTDFGIQLERVDGEITDFSLSCNSLGEVFVSMITRSLLPQKVTKTILKLGVSGEIITKFVSYQKTEGIIHSSQIIANDSQTAGLFWIETVNNKSILNFKSENISNKDSKNPITISNTRENVLDFSVSKYGDDFYVIWTVLAQNKRIYHQLISSKGIKKWGAEGRILTSLKGSNSNPKHAFFNNKIIITWVNEINKDKNIYADAFDVKGEKIWDKNPLPIINIKGDQFGQQIVSDNKGGFIIAWIDRRKSEDFGNIYAQKITLDKKFLWDSTGVDLGTSPKSQKSYLNLIEDKSGGAIAVFKDKRNDGCEIYGQKIFSTGTYAGQILGLKSELFGDSVKISWFAANESNITDYDILRKSENESSWKTIASLRKISSNNINYYEYYDFPDYNGQISYKVVQKISGKENQFSDITTVNYISDLSNYILFQNSPNPFSEKTTISFSIPFGQQVEIEIFDVRLNPIKVLVKDYFSEGKHTIIFNADELTPGIYFYRLKAGDFIAVKKMVVNK